MSTVDALVAFYESLTPASLARLERFYVPDAHFVDPFNEVRGVPAIAAIFSHMFASVAAPRFTVHSRCMGEGVAMLAWTFRGTLAGRAIAFEGATQFIFASDGRVQTHRDFWDAAGAFYESVPGLGAMLRCVRGRLAAPQPGGTEMPPAR